MENAIEVKYHLFELTSQMWEGQFERKSQSELVKSVEIF